MRNACRKAFAAALASLLCLSSSFAQEYPNGLSADSVDPEADAAFIREMREKMDRIRRDEHRPTVALVLSGGGAKGSAHVGVLKLIEELDIPVDMICGTSMGGLVGGLYSMGYPSEYLDSLLRNQNWDITLSDKVSPSYIPYTTKEYKSRYLLSIPFHYDRRTLEKERKKQIRMMKRDGLHLEADAADLTTEAGVNNFASSLPSGYVYGFNVNNLLSSLTVGYQDSIAFSTLPIPYFCVASDMVSCKAKNWGSGQVKSAMRSTMSIPGMFDPVRTDGMALVDGGTRNNFPVDLARAMGADFVIGVELSDASPDFNQVRNLGNILSQFITMLGQDAFNKNVDAADVFIKPDLEGYNMLSFTPTAIDTMISRGYQAADLHRDELMDIKMRMAGSSLTLRNRKATDINVEPVLISEVSFSGLVDAESRMMMRKIDLEAGQLVDKSMLDVAMSKLQATGSFESVTYSLLGSGEPYKLVFNCVKGPVNQFGVGFRVDNDQWATLLLNAGFGTGKLKGSKLDLEARIGLNRYVDARYSLDIPGLPTINAEAHLFENSGDMLNGGELHNYNINFRGNKESVYFSNIRWTRFDIKLGAEYKHFYTRSLLSDSDIIFDRKTLDSYFSGGFLSGVGQARYYSFDNKYYPSKGTDLKIGGEYIFASIHADDFKPVPIASIDFKTVIRIGGSVALIPDIHARSVMRSRANICQSNAVGGLLAGRQLEQQVPFVGFSEAYIAEDQMAVANLDFRVKAAKNLYFSAMAGYIHQSPDFGGLFTSLDKDIYGFGFQAGYNTIFGPIKAHLNWSSLNTKKVGFYFSAGFDF